MSEETGTSIISDEERREALRQKIAASEARNAERSFADQARDAADTALDYVREHPLRSVAVVATGALIIGAFTRSGRRLGRRSGRVATLAANTAVTYGLRMLDNAIETAETGQDRLADFGDNVGVKARKFQRTATKEAADAGDRLRATAKRSGRHAKRSIKDLRSRFMH